MESCIVHKTQLTYIYIVPHYTSCLPRQQTFAQVSVSVLPFCLAASTSVSVRPRSISRERRRASYRSCSKNGDLYIFLSSLQAKRTTFIYFTCEVIFSSPPSESSSSSWMVDWFGIGATSSVVHWVSLLLQRRLKNTYQVLLNKLLKFQMQSTKSLIKKKKCWRWMNTSSSSSMSYRREFQGKTSTRVTKSLLVCLQ